ncbi:MAG: Crp/Fnr family transcriptional regulator [Anaerolineae bacterium]|nr:Crp/Fnr family transcriptional regulator [Anaerolineae bacterium]
MQVSIEDIRHIECFDQLSAPTLAALAAIAQPMVFDRHQVFYQQGEMPSGVYCLQSGQVKLYRQAGAKIQILVIVQVGGAFGVEVLNGRPVAACNAEATVKGVGFYLPSDKLCHLLRVNAELALAFLGLLSDQFLTMSNLVYDLVFHDVSARLALFLLRQDRYPSLEGHCISRNFSQQELAAVLGTGREVVCRTLKRFETEGILRVIPRKILILDLARLTALANQDGSN